MWAGRKVDGEDDETKEYYGLHGGGGLNRYKFAFVVGIIFCIFVGLPASGKSLGSAYVRRQLRPVVFQVRYVFPVYLDDVNAFVRRVGKHCGLESGHGYLDFVEGFFGWCWVG